MSAKKIAMIAIVSMLSVLSNGALPVRRRIPPRIAESSHDGIS